MFPGIRSRSPSEVWLALLAALAMGLLLVSMNAVEIKWFIALLAALVFSAAAVLAGNIERFLFGSLFFLIPLNADFQLRTISVWHGSELPNGTPQLGISVMDMVLAALYVCWIGRLMTQKRQAVFWPSGVLCLVVFIGWGAVSLLNARSLELGLFLLVGYLKSFLLFFYVANQVRTREDLVLAAKCMVAGMAVESLIVFAEHKAGRNLGLEALGERKVEKETELIAESVFRPGGTLGHPNALGGYLASVLPVALALHFLPKRGRPSSGWTLIPIVLGCGALVLSLSRSAWLAGGFACVGLMVSVIRRFRRSFRWKPVLGLGALGVVAALLFGPLILTRWEADDRGSTLSRIPQMQMGLAVIRQHPFLGIGLNNYPIVSHLYETDVMNPNPRQRVFEYGGRIHDGFIAVGVEMGLVGLAALAGFLFAVLRVGWRRIGRSRDEVVSWILMAVFWGMIARIFHDAAHTSDAASIQRLWVYPALLVSAAGAAAAQGDAQ